LNAHCIAFRVEQCLDAGRETWMPVALDEKLNGDNMNISSPLKKLKIFARRVPLRTTGFWSQ
jgi:hypothetical protein